MAADSLAFAPVALPRPDLRPAALWLEPLCSQGRRVLGARSGPVQGVKSAAETLQSPNSLGPPVLPQANRRPLQ